MWTPSHTSTRCTVCCQLCQRMDGQCAWFRVGEPEKCRREVPNTHWPWKQRSDRTSNKARNTCYSLHENDVCYKLQLQFLLLDNSIPFENPAAILVYLLPGSQSRQRHWPKAELSNVPIPFGTSRAASLLGLTKCLSSERVGRCLSDEDFFFLVERAAAKVFNSGMLFNET